MINDPVWVYLHLPKVCQNAKKDDKKPLQDRQKGRLGAAIEALKNPILATLKIKALRNIVRPFFFKAYKCP
jgi:hypothetical protein